MKGCEQLKDLIITNFGKKLITETFINDSTLIFTKVCVSSKLHDENTLAGLTEIDDIKQNIFELDLKRISSNAVEMRVDVTNIGVLEDFEINTLGIFAKNSENEEILFGVCVADEVPNVIRAFRDDVLGYSYKINIAIDNADKIDIIIGGISEELIDKVVDKVESSLDETVKNLVSVYIGTFGDDLNTILKQVKHTSKLSPSGNTSGTLHEKVNRISKDIELNDGDVTIGEKINKIMSKLEPDSSDDNNIHEKLDKLLDSLNSLDDGNSDLNVADILEQVKYSSKLSPSGNTSGTLHEKVNRISKDIALNDGDVTIGEKINKIMSKLEPDSNDGVFEKLNKILDILGSDDLNISEMLEEILKNTSGDGSSSRIIKSIQRGTVESRGSSVTVPISEVSLDRAIIIANGYEPGLIPLGGYSATVHGGFLIRFKDSRSLLVPASGNGVYVDWQVIEFN